MADKKVGFIKSIREKRSLKKEYGKFRKYAWYLEHMKVDDTLILLESQRGTSFGGNIAAIARELVQNPVFEGFKVVLSCVEEQMDQRRCFLDRHDMQQVQVVSVSDKKYFKILATAKFLINDNTFAACFTKRPEQVYLNTWHGTPLKTLGKQIKEECGMIGNAQRNFFCADYLLCPNEFTRDRLTEDYMVTKFGKTKLLLTGYPRNCIFTDKKRREEMRKEYGFEGLQVFAYLPTWRGVTAGVQSDQQNQQLLAYFEKLDQMLTDRQVVYVKLHPISVKAINLSGFQHILPFPSEYETYEFLNATDGLITDYSSVFFDYAITGQKIVLFTYDKKEYTRERGFYFPMEDLPFPQVETVEALVQELNTGKNYDDTDFLETYCKYDNAGVTEALCRRVIFGEANALITEQESVENGRKNVLLYAGDLALNRTTENFFELIRELDTSKYNYMLVYRIESVKYRQEQLSRLPEGMEYYGYFVYHGLSKYDMERYEFWKEHIWCPDIVAKKPLKRLLDNEVHRIFGGMRIDCAVDVTGNTELLVLTFIKCNLLRIRLKSTMPQKKGLIEKRMARKQIESYIPVDAFSTEQLEAAVAAACRRGGTDE